MNINFKTHFPWPGSDGKPGPTFFKDWIENSIAFPDMEDKLAKHHTIRRIKTKPRFREGMKLTFSTGSRFKPVRFGEAVCSGTQFLRMDCAHYAGGISLGVWIEEPGVLHRPMTLEQMHRLAMNDGLSVENFLKWFLLDVITNGPGHYEIVHWTDLQY